MAPYDEAQLYAKINRIMELLEEQAEVNQIFIAALNNMNARLDGQIEIGTIQTSMIGRLADAPPYREKKG